MDHAPDFRTWNIFRRLQDESLCCAVPAEVPVPSFLMSGAWKFGFAVAVDDPPVGGFSVAAAEAGTTFDGFYLFLASAAPSNGPH